MTIRSIFADKLRPAMRPTLTERLLLWRQRRRSRLALSRLGPTLLRDVGISASVAAREFRKPFWRE